MIRALQLFPRQQATCLNFSRAYEMVIQACELINRTFSPERLTRMAINFDALVQSGQPGDTSIITAITREMEEHGDPKVVEMVKRRPATPALRESFGMACLPRSEETALLLLIHAHGLPVSALACNMTRQTGEGQYNRRPDIEWILDGERIVITKVIPRRGRITYDLELCEYCGNLEPYAHCPAKLRALRERLLDQGDEEMLTRQIE